MSFRYAMTDRSALVEDSRSFSSSRRESSATSGIEPAIFFASSLSSSLEAVSPRTKVEGSGILRGGVSIGRKLLRLAALEVLEVAGTKPLGDGTVAVCRAAFRALLDGFRSIVCSEGVDPWPIDKAPSAPVVEIRMLMRGEVEGSDGESGFATRL